MDRFSYYQPGDSMEGILCQAGNVAIYEGELKQVCAYFSAFLSISFPKKYLLCVNFILLKFTKLSTTSSHQLIPTHPSKEIKTMELIDFDYF